MAAVLYSLSAQDQEPAVLKETVSVHTVERGNMPIQEPAAGAVVSLQPPKAVVKLSRPGAEPCKPGQKALAQIDPKVMTGKIVTANSGRCEIEFSGALPGGVAIGKEIGALIEAGEMRDVVFFGRPADSAPDSEAFLFAIEPGDQHARRVVVRYGQMSGALIQVLSGLSPGDRVIVTGMSKWMSSPRVRLQ